MVFIFTFRHFAGIVICRNHFIFNNLQQHTQLCLWFGQNVVVQQHRKCRSPRMNKIHHRLFVRLIISCTGILYERFKLHQWTSTGYTLKFIIEAMVLVYYNSEFQQYIKCIILLLLRKTWMAFCGTWWQLTKIRQPFCNKQTKYLNSQQGRSLQQYTFRASVLEAVQSFEGQ